MRKIATVVALLFLAAACASSGEGADDPTGADTPPTSGGANDSTVTTASAGLTTTPSTSSGPTDADPGPCDGGGIGTGSTQGVLVSGGVEYPYQVFVPTSHDGRAMPLVLEFHGLGSDGPTQSAFSGYAALALREGFVVVNPTGPPAEDDTRNSWELAQFDVPGRDDVGMVADLVDTVAEMVCIDQARVYATGMSNGGFFSSRLACELSDRIAAVFAVAAIGHPDGCVPSRPVPVGAVHGTADEVVPYAGGGDSVLLSDDLDADVRAAFAEFFEQVMPDEAAEFAADYHCGTVTDTEVGPDTTLTVYSDCDGGAEVRFYTVEGGGHTWPGSPFAGAYESALGYSTADVDATEDGWAFVSRYSLDD